jgi:hypothetical protein
MGTLLRSFVLFAALGGILVATDLAVAPAQTKDKKDDKKADAKADEIGVTEVYMAKDGWRFRIKNPEGKSIAIGTTGHDKKEEALHIVEQVKLTLTKGKVVEIKEDKK